jgi:hypothetical protein
MGELLQLFWRHIKEANALVGILVLVVFGLAFYGANASAQEANAALDEYTTALRDVFGVDANDDIDGPFDEAPDHKRRCEPIQFRCAKLQTN